jgi:hypothetical protein
LREIVRATEIRDHTRHSACWALAVRVSSDSSTVLLLMATLALVGGVSIAFKNLVDRDAEVEDRDPPPRSAAALARDNHVTLEPLGGRWGDVAAPLPPDDAPTVVVTRTAILFDGVLVAPLSSARAHADAGVEDRYKRSPDDLMIVPLVQALVARCDRVREAGPHEPCTLRVLADEATPARVLNEVSFTAGAAGYTNVRPVVRDADGGLVAATKGASPTGDESRPARP